MAALRERLERAITEHVFPGAALGVIEKGGERTLCSVGRFTYDADSPKVHDDTVYDVASITKSVPVALLALQYLEEGLLGLDESVVKYLPEIRTPHAEQAQIRHLLTYTYILEKNVDPNFSYEHVQASDIHDFLYTRPFAFPPGTQYAYSNTPANLLGIILERLSGKKLHALARERVLEPLCMHSSTFQPEIPSAIPPTEVIPWRGEIQGVVHDETAFILERDGFDPGCAGLFSNVDDLLNVAGMLLNDGMYEGVQFVSPKTIVAMTTNALSAIGESSGIGFELNQPQFMGKNSHEHMIGKTGFTGTSFVIDMERGRAVVLLSNRTYPKRSSSDAISRVRADISDIVFSDV